MAQEVCLQLPGGESAKLHSGLQSAGRLRANAKDDGIGFDKSIRQKKHNTVATDQLLELLKHHHPSHAPAWVAAKPAELLENPAPSDVINTSAPLLADVSGTDERGAPRAPPVIGMAEAVMRAACKHYGIGRETLFAKHRHAPAVRRRFVTIYVARELSGISLHRLAQKFNMDHSSVLHAVRRVSQGLQGYAADVDAIRAIAKGVRAYVKPICPHCQRPMDDAMVTS